MAELEDIDLLESDEIEDDDLDDVEEVLDEFDDDDDGELVEEDDDLDGEDAAERRRRRWRRRRYRYPRSRGGGYYQRMLKGYATKKQLRAALARVGRDIRRNRAAITTNRRRLGEVSRRASANRRTIARQDSAIRAVRKSVDDTRQLFVLTSLLGGDQTLELAAARDGSGNATTNFAEVKTLELKQADKMDKLLPLLLLGGLGGGKGGLMENPLMLLLLAGALD